MAPSMWQQTEEMAKKHDQGGSLWLKLGNDGDKAAVVFLGEPHPREVCFVDGKCMPFDEKLKAQGLKPSLRVALNVALYDSKEVKVLEQGVMFFKDLVRVREKYGLERWAFEIQRHGAAKDPETTYSVLPEHQLSPEQQKAFQALPQHDLEKLYAGESEGSGDAAAPYTVAPALRDQLPVGHFATHSAASMARFGAHSQPPRLGGGLGAEGDGDVSAQDRADWERMAASGEHTGAVCRGFADRITAILDAPPEPTEVAQ